MTSGSLTGCYGYTTAKGSWSACKTYCEGINSTLVNLETTAEITLVTSKLTAGGTRYWVFFNFNRIYIPTEKSEKKNYLHDGFNKNILRVYS